MPKYLHSNALSALDPEPDEPLEVEEEEEEEEEPHFPLQSGVMIGVEEPQDVSRGARRVHYQSSVFPSDSTQKIQRGVLKR